MEEELKENYRKFITDGAFYVCSLLAERTPALYGDPGGSISWQELLQLHEGDEVPQWRHQLLEYFTCPQRILHFYEGIVEAVYCLKLIDLKKTGRKRGDYQDLYPSLILETYGRGRLLSAVFSYDSTKGAGTVRYDRIRRTALNVLIEDILAENGREGYVDYDFESENARKVLKEMLQRVESAKEEERLVQTKRIFRRVCRHTLTGTIEEAAGALIDAVEENPVPGLSELTRLKTDVLPAEDGSLIVRGRTDKAKGTFILFIDGAARGVSRVPIFGKKYLRTDSLGRSVYKRLTPEDLYGKDVAVCKAGGGKALKTKITPEDGFDVVSTRAQAHCRSYTLRVDGVELHKSRRPVFKIYEEGAFTGHKVEIIANRDFNDLYLIFEAARKYDLRNYLLELTDPKRNTLNNSYSILLLAGGSLDVIQRVSPENHRKILDVIEARKNANLKNLWPLACIFTP